MTRDEVLSDLMLRAATSRGPDLDVFLIVAKRRRPTVANCSASGATGLAGDRSWMRASSPLTLLSDTGRRLVSDASFQDAPRNHLCGPR